MIYRYHFPKIFAVFPIFLPRIEDMFSIKTDYIPHYNYARYYKEFFVPCEYDLPRARIKEFIVYF